MLLLKSATLELQLGGYSGYQKSQFFLDLEIYNWLLLRKENLQTAAAHKKLRQCIFTS